MAGMNRLAEVLIAGRLDYFTIYLKLFASAVKKTSIGGKVLEIIRFDIKKRWKVGVKSYPCHQRWQYQSEINNSCSWSPNVHGTLFLISGNSKNFLITTRIYLNVA